MRDLQIIQLLLGALVIANLLGFLVFKLLSKPVPKESDPARLWALAIGGLFVHRFKGKHNVMHFLTVAGRGLFNVKMSLDNDWDIGPQKTEEQRHHAAIETLEWLLHHGHRASYLEDNQAAQKGAETSMEDVLAFDMVRVNFVARGCATFGYITDEQAWYYILAGAQTVQNHFSNWEEFGAAYVRGRAWWSPKPNPKWVHKELDAVLKNPQSGWHQWHQPPVSPGFVEQPLTPPRQPNKY